MADLDTDPRLDYLSRLDRLTCDMDAALSSSVSHTTQTQHATLELRAFDAALGGELDRLDQDRLEQFLLDAAQALRKAHAIVRRGVTYVEVALQRVAQSEGQSCA